MRGGEDEGEVREAVRAFSADIVHCHNMLPLLGPRALDAARDAGARVFLHLHNYRLFCNVYAGFRNGHPCFRCRGRNTLPGLVLNCRGSVPESAAYAVGLSRHQPRVLRSVERFVTPSEAARRRLAWLGLPEEQIAVLPNYLPDESFAQGSSAGEGTYALVAGRVTPEKGFEQAVAAAERSGVPLRVAGDGPAMAGLREARRAERRAGGAARPRGRREDARARWRGRRWWWFRRSGRRRSGWSRSRAWARACRSRRSRTGALPEVAGEESCVPAADTDALAERMRALWGDAARRQAEGEAALARARERFGRERFTRELLAIYA